MKDITHDPFEEYLRSREPGEREKGYAWQTAIGLQKADGLETSEYLRKTAYQHIEGKISIDEAKHLIESYYKQPRKKLIENRTLNLKNRTSGAKNRTFGAKNRTFKRMHIVQKSDFRMS